MQFKETEWRCLLFSRLIIDFSAVWIEGVGGRPMVLQICAYASWLERRPGLLLLAISLGLRRAFIRSSDWYTDNNDEFMKPTIMHPWRYQHTRRLFCLSPIRPNGQKLFVEATTVFIAPSDLPSKIFSSINPASTPLLRLRPYFQLPMVSGSAPEAKTARWLPRSRSTE